MDGLMLFGELFMYESSFFFFLFGLDEKIEKKGREKEKEKSSTILLR